jgi:VWFA-related protein
MKTMKTTALVLTLLAAATVLVADTPYIETFEVRLHNLDVVVTDAKGKPVQGLTKNDFVVVENGVPQPITNFAIYDAQSGAATSSAPMSAPGSANEPAANVVSAPPPRHVVFFIDELSLQGMARRTLYNNVKGFVDQLRAGDVAAVVRPTSEAKIVQEFTGDRAAIEAALKKAIDESADQFAGPKREQQALRAALRNADGNKDVMQIAKLEYAALAGRRVAHRLGQIRALTTSLAGVEGKKVVVLVTMGLTSKPGYEAWSLEELLGAEDPLDLAPDAMELPSELQLSDPEQRRSPWVHDFTKQIADIGRSAAANGVTIYAIEPDIQLDIATRGSASTPTATRRNGSAMNDPRMEVQRNFQSDLLQNAEVTLASLTSETGGRWFRGMSSMDDAFRQVNEDVSFYYSLAYRAKGEYDKPRRVTVTIRNRPELRVRTRSEVLEKSTEKEMTDLVVASLLYPRPVNELGINVTAGTPQKTRGLYTVPLEVVMPLKNLTFLPTDAGQYAASFNLHYAAAGEERDFGAGGKREQHIEITPEQFANIATINYRYKTGIQVSPGHARIAIGVLDNATKLTGFRTIDVVTQ